MFVVFLLLLRRASLYASLVLRDTWSCVLFNRPSSTQTCTFSTSKSGPLEVVLSHPAYSPRTYTCTCSQTHTHIHTNTCKHMPTLYVPTHVRTRKHAYCTLKHTTQTQTAYLCASTTLKLNRVQRILLWVGSVIHCVFSYKISDQN